MDELNRRFKQYRIASNVTQDELSEKTGVSVYTIKNFEGGSDIKLSTLKKLLNGLGISNVFDELIPAITDRPSYRAKKEEGKVRQRARKTEKTIDWQWGGQQ